jgi:hypothetical protein
MMRIGPSFDAELRAAGLAGEAFSWGSDGKIEFREDVPRATRDQVMAVLAAHDPTRPAPPTARDQAIAEIRALDPATIADTRLRWLVERLQKII